jgi:hypothetical protein
MVRQAIQRIMVLCGDKYAADSRSATGASGPTVTYVGPGCLTFGGRTVTSITADRPGT